jgi:hypothetical protein
MGIFRRLKRLWELSGEPEKLPDFNFGVIDAPKTEHFDHFVAPSNIRLEPITTVQELAHVVITGKPIGQATIVQDDPLDIFQNDEPEQQPDAPGSDAALS